MAQHTLKNFLESHYEIIPEEIRISDKDYELMKAQVFQNIENMVKS